LFSIPECDWADEKDIRLINNSRLLFRARNNGEGDGDEESCVFSFSSMPCKSEEEFNKTLTTLPEDFPEVDAPDVDDAIVEQMSREQIIPDYFDSSTMLYRHIHKTAFAVLESKNNSMCGNVYFMSTRNPQKLKMLRHMVVHFMDSFIDNDLCSAPQKIWLMTTDCIFYMGPQVGELRKEKLECDKTDGRIGRLTPALWMVSEEGDAAGAIKFMKETLNNLHINTPSLLCGRTIIYYAIFGNKPEALRLLIAAGANVNHLDDAKVSPLMLAASLLNVECVRVLCENGANPRIHGKDQKTALLFTGEKGSSDDIIRVMGLLFSAGAKPNEADDRNETVLFKPCGFKDPKILRFLLGKGADPKHLDNNGNTLLHACVGKKTHEGMVVILVKELGIDINAQNNMGTTALSMHIFSLSLKDVEFWVNELKADTTIKDIAGISAHRRYTSNPCYVINHQQYHKNYAEISAILKEK
jgi:ankyrin repeat protein